MLTCRITPELLLDIWFEKTNETATLFCKKHTDNKPIDECIKYPILSILNTGELKRHPGLPVGWGFILTDKQKVKEVR